MRRSKHVMVVIVGVLAVVVTGAVAPGAGAASGWGIQPTPDPSGAQEAILDAVSCTSSTACTAVGYSQGSSGPVVALAERRTGATWVVQPVPEPAGVTNAVLNGVSCTSATACTAVGNYSDSAGNTWTLAEAWNGATWAIQTTPDPSGTTNAVLSGGSCTSSTACTAVGHHFGSAAIANLAEAWNGTKWVIQKTPDPTGGAVAELYGVSCASAVACTAVGFSLTTANVDLVLAEAWNGTKWVIRPTPNPTGALQAHLNGVSCTLATACSAAGYANFNSTDDALVEAHP